MRKLLSDALTMLLIGRLLWTSGKMALLLARFQAGKLWRCKPRVVAVDRPAEMVERAAAALPRVWPMRFGWLVRLGGWRVAGHGEQLRFVLEQPEMVALLVASPQARRILRPLCRMLAVETALLRPLAPGAVAEVAPEKIVKVATKRVRAPRPAVDWGRIPLPRGVLAKARRQGFGKIPPKIAD